MWPARRRDCDKGGGRSRGIGAVAAASLPCRRALDTSDWKEKKKKRHVSEGNASVREEILSEATNLQQMEAEGGGGREIAAPEKTKKRQQEYFHQDSRRIVYKKTISCNKFGP